MTDMEKKIMLRLCAKVIEYVDFETDPEAERLVNWVILDNQKKADKSPALNPDLWEKALELAEKHTITYVWVKGHAGHPENERCDRLAVAQSKAHGGRQN